MRIARGRLGEFGYTASSLFFPREYGIGPRGLGFRGEGGMWEVGSERRDEVCGGGGVKVHGGGLGDEEMRGWGGVRGWDGDGVGWRGRGK